MKKHLPILLLSIFVTLSLTKAQAQVRKLPAINVADDDRTGQKAEIQLNGVTVIDSTGAVFVNGYYIGSIGTTNGFGILPDPIPVITNRRNLLMGSVNADTISGSENHIYSTKFGNSETYMDKVTAAGMYPAASAKYIIDSDFFGRAAAYRVDTVTHSHFIGNQVGLWLDSTASYAFLLGMGAGNGLDHISSSVHLNTPSGGSTQFNGLDILDKSVIIGHISGDITNYVTPKTARWGMDSISALVWLGDGNGNPAYSRTANSVHTFWDTTGNPAFKIDSLNQVNFYGGLVDANGLAFTEGKVPMIKNGQVAAGDVLDADSIIYQTEVIDFPSVAAGGNSDQTVTVSGLDVTDRIIVNPDKTALTTNVVFQAWVNGANTLAIRCSNYTAGALDPASANFYITVIKN